MPEKNEDEKNMFLIIYIWFYIQNKISSGKIFMNDNKNDVIWHKINLKIHSLLPLYTPPFFKSDSYYNNPYGPY